MKKTFIVEGMHCKSCEILLTDALTDEGAKVLSISHKNGNLNVEFDEKKLSDTKIRQIIEHEGYKVKL